MMNENEFYAFLITVAIVLCFTIKCYNQNVIKSKQLVVDCYQQTHEKECFNLKVK